MQAKSFRIHLILFLFFTTIISYSQEANSQKDSISKKIEGYFFLERENIHLHFDKNTFLSGEKAWLKGYVYHRKKSAPFFTTTNVYATLYNEKGIKIEDKLFYANNGSFTGNFELNDTLPTGKYYVQVFTNWIKNFKEDESSTYKINLINKNDESYSKNTPDYSKINIAFSPEGGSVIEGIKNNIGIMVRDCNGNPIAISEAELIDPSGKVLQKINLNTFGLGKFELTPDFKTYKVRFAFGSKTFEGIVPAVISKGVCLEANSYAVKNKTVIKIRTNSKSIDDYTSKPLFMVVHQDDKSAIFDIDFKNKSLEQTIAFTNDILFPGVNTVRIIDSENNQIAERLVFKYPSENLQLDFESIKKNKDTVTVKSRFNFINTNVSITVLPEESLALDEEDDIYAAFLLNPYLNKKASFSRYYFNETTLKKAYELDLLLLNQESSKYKWQDIKGTAPKTEFDFDFGLTLKGTVNQNLSNPKNNKVNMLALQYGINESADIDLKKEFYFNNLVFEDSTFVSFNLIDEKNKSKAFKVYPQLLNGRRAFNKPFFVKNESCLIKSETVALKMPKFAAGSIHLEAVEINKTVEKKLKRSSLAGNSHLRGFQITEENNHMDLMQFFRINGFEVVYDHVKGTDTIQIFSNARMANPFKPIIYVDNIELLSQEMLLGLRMSEIDEIYLNPHAIVSSIKGYMGVIKIYRKSILDDKRSNNRNAMSYVVQRGFSRNETFKNAQYTSTADEGFRNFGLMDWIPSIITNETNTFIFKFPAYGQKKARLLIEGFSADGKLISEIRTVDFEH